MLSGPRPEHGNQASTSLPLAWAPSYGHSHCGSHPAAESVFVDPSHRQGQVAAVPTAGQNAGRERDVFAVGRFQGVADVHLAVDHALDDVLNLSNGCGLSGGEDCRLII